MGFVFLFWDELIVGLIDLSLCTEKSKSCG